MEGLGKILPSNRPLPQNPAKTYVARMNPIESMTAHMISSSSITLNPKPRFLNMIYRTWGDRLVTSASNLELGFGLQIRA